MYNASSVQTAPRISLRVISRPQTWHSRAVEAYRQAQHEEESASLGTMLASESVLRRDWDHPEEDSAWSEL